MTCSFNFTLNKTLKYKFTKKKLKIMLFKLKWGFFKPRQKAFKSHISLKRIMSNKQLFLFYIFHRNLLRKLYGIYKYKQFSTLHKLFFKKKKKKLYSQGFILFLEQKLSTILFRSRLLSKLNYLRYVFKTTGIFLNGVLTLNTKLSIKPLDFVQCSQLFLKNNKFLYCLIDKPIKSLLLRFLTDLRFLCRSFRLFWLCKLKYRFFFFLKFIKLSKLSFLNFYKEKWVVFVLLKIINFIILKFLNCLIKSFNKKYIPRYNFQKFFFLKSDNFYYSKNKKYFLFFIFIHCLIVS